MRLVFPFAMIFMLFSVFVLLRSPVPMGSEELASTDNQCSHEHAFTQSTQHLAPDNHLWSALRSLDLGRATSCLLKYAKNEPFADSSEARRCEELSSQRFTPGSCSAFLDEVSTKIFDVPLPVVLEEHYGPTSTAFNPNVRHYLDQIFQARAIIHQKLPSFIGQTSVPQMKACLQSLKNFHRKSRRFEDSLALWYLWNRKGTQPSHDISERFRQMTFELRDNVPLVRFGRSQTQQQSSFARLAFSSLEPYTFVFLNGMTGTEEQLRDKKFDRLELQPGDILLTQPKAFHHILLSETLAPGGSFSQAVIVHTDKDVDGGTQIRLLSSDPTRGLVDNRDVQGFFEDQVRILLLRHPDRELALQASQEASHIRINNDLSFLPDQHKAIALGTLAYISASYDRAFQALAKRASEGEGTPPFDLFGQQLGFSGFQIPIFTPEPAQAQHDTLRLLVHGTTDAAAPSLEKLSPASLLEFDPRFELVAEWRDYSRIEALNMIQNSLQSLLEWDADENLNYTWIDSELKSNRSDNPYHCRSEISGTLFCQLTASCPLDSARGSTPFDLSNYQKACVAAREVAFTMTDSLVNYDSFVRARSRNDSGHRTRWGLNDFLQAQYLDQQRNCSLENWRSNAQQRETNPFAWLRFWAPKEQGLHKLFRPEEFK